MKKPPYYPPIIPGRYYHIYNRANGSENLFREEANFLKFLELYEKYINPVADTFAWVLMPNHFHLLVRIKEDMYYKYSKVGFDKITSPKQNAGKSSAADEVGIDNREFDEVKWQTINLSTTEESEGGKTRKIANPINHFSHLCNAYAKYVNAKYNRHGSLFQRPFRRKPVEDENYLRRLTIYIHNNPVHHRFAKNLQDYPWSSYRTFLSAPVIKINQTTVLHWFGGIRHFQAAHLVNVDDVSLKDWLEDDQEVN